MRSVLNLKKSKKGQGTISLVIATVVAFLVFVVTVIAVLLAAGTLNSSGIFKASTAGANTTTTLIGNTTQGIAQFGSNIPTVFTVLGVLLIVGVIVLLIVLIKRAQGSMSSGSGAL